MQFSVLGPLTVRTADGTPVTIPGAKVRALLAVLLVHRGEPVSADKLIDELWGDDPPRNAPGALQVKVSQLRKALDDAQPGARELVVSRPAGYLLAVGPEAVDAGRFTGLIADKRPAEALELWRGPAFADFADEQFARAAIAYLTELRLSAFEDHAEAQLDIGRHSALVGELTRLVEQNPLRERLCGALMRALYRSGRQAEALETYRVLSERLAEELGVDPSPDLARLYEAILRQDPALGGPSGSNLAAPVTDLVGRAEALAEVRHLLATARLVTLTGIGGVGKTRLALEAARHRDNAWMVEFAGFGRAGATPDSLADLVSSALGIRDDARSPGAAGSAGQLAEALRHKQMLLVLDNCEHLIDPVAELTELLLRSAPALTVLATSREPLGIAGEQLFPVMPLALPDGDDPAHISQSAAVRLFVARAAAVTPSFTIVPGNARAIAAICRRLDGLPLALELAAARVRMLGVHDLAIRLEDRFRVLTSGHRTAPARQQTLRAMIDWSWDLLSANERVVLRRLAVHAESGTLRSAEAVCAGAGVAAEDVLDLLARLVDRSLVVTAEGAGGVRYRLLETVAAYSRERLAEAGEEAGVRRAHAQYYLVLAEQADGRLRGHDQRQWLEQLDAEAGNLRAALATARRENTADFGLRLVNALSWYWFLRGRYQEAHRAITAALSIDGDAPAAVRADAQAWQIAIAFLQGSDNTPLEHGKAVLELYDDPAALARARWLFGFVGRSGSPAAAAQMISEALPVFRSLGDQWGLAAGLGTLSAVALMRGDLAAARRDATTAAELFAELGDRWGQIQTAEILGQLAEIAGDQQTSGRVHHEALRMAEELEIWPFVAQQLARMGRHALLDGDHAAAKEFLERALRVAEAHSYEAGVNLARGGLALLARRQGRFEAAEDLLRSLLLWERRINYDAGIAFGLTELGFNAEQRGDAPTALALHSEGLATALTTGDPRAVAHALEGLAGVRVLTGAHTLAAQLLGSAAAARESVGFPLPSAERGDVDRITASVRAALGDETLATELERGRDLDVQDLLDTRE